ncbi:MAG: GNAT family N-acetyltransferase [Bryobacteraceae bacterium]
MAALPEYPAPSLVELRYLRPEQFDRLLAAEGDVWDTRLDWDFRPSADLVRRFVRMQSLGGYALVAGHEPVGYCYYVCEERKGLLGDIFILPEYDAPDLELALVDASLRAVWSTPGIHRVESQLMLLSSAAAARMPDRLRMETFRRQFMIAELTGRSSPLAHLPERSLPPGIEIVPWREYEQEAAARLIARAYKGHVDASINDQYCSVSGARRFLHNIVQYPGCGSFQSAASMCARDRVDGRLVGLSLASFIAYDVGHITQICVDPDWKGEGIGYEMLRRSSSALSGIGCRRVSLSVTSSNAEAVRLYERTGFRVAHEFDAFVWNRPELRAG